MNTTLKLFCTEINTFIDSFIKMNKFFKHVNSVKFKYTRQKHVFIIKNLTAYITYSIELSSRLFYNTKKGKLSFELKWLLNVQNLDISFVLYVFVLDILINYGLFNNLFKIFS